MQITFYGAAQEVTGSMHLIEINGQRILLDCGLYQGRRAETYERNLHFPFAPSSIDTMVLSHAHIDHSGNIPNLIKQGYTGHVWCTSATRDLCAYMLLDSGHIQEQDIEYVNKKRARAGLPPQVPIYTKADAQVALRSFIGMNLHRKVSIADGVDLTFYNAGHILGSAFVVLDLHDKQTGRQRRLVFSGDLGRPDAPILKTPDPIGDTDILIIEGTYGNRMHGPYADARSKLRDIVRATSRRRGKLIIPSFAVGRTQELVYALNQLEAQGDIAALPVYVDSPLAVNATEVFRMHPDEWDEGVRDFLLEGQGRRPFDSRNLHYIQDQAESKRLNYLTQPVIIISASGMAENGRILHHLKNNIEDRDNTILLVSFQAENTLGRRLAEGVSPVRIFGEEYTVRAHVEKLEGYSAHADQGELLAWAGTATPGRLQQTFVVHAEPGPAATLAKALGEQTGAEVTAPERGMSCEF